MHSILFYPQKDFIIWGALDFLVLDSLWQRLFFPQERFFCFNVIFQNKFSCSPLLFPFDSHHCWVMPKVMLLKSRFFICNIAAEPITQYISRGLGTCPFIKYRLNSARDVSGTRVRCKSVKKYKSENHQL